jgi:hypothetical protein
MPGPIHKYDRYLYPGGVGWIGSGWNYEGAVAPVNLNETMSDDPSPLTKGFKPCAHSRFDLKLFNRESFTRPGNDYFDIFTADTLHRDALFLYGMGSPTLSDFNRVDWEFERERSWQKVKPGIQSGLSSLNFLAELKDIKRLVSLWKRYDGRIAELRARKAYRWLKNVAGAHLNVSFGWKPLISDIESSISSMINFNEKWNRLLAEAEKPQVRHYSRTLSESSDSSVTHGFSNSTWLNYTIEEEVAPLKYSFTARFRYRIPQAVGGIPNKLLAYMDAFGLNANPWIVWEAIPYSFCVDWLFNVGDFLDSLKFESLPIVCSIEDVCHSVKQSGVRTVTAHERRVSPSGTMPDRLLFTARQTSYDRRTTQLTGVVPLRSKIPKWGQVALATSLAITKSSWIKPANLARLYVPHRIFTPRRHTGR